MAKIIDIVSFVSTLYKTPETVSVIAFRVLISVKMEDVPEDIFNFIDDIGDLEMGELEDEGYRFGNEEKVEFLTSKHYSANTTKKIHYVLRLWKEWVSCSLIFVRFYLIYTICVFQVGEKNRKLRLSTKKVPTKSFHEFADDELCEWLPFFLAEIRTKQKEPYRALSYLEFCLCLQSYLKIHERDCRFLVEPKFSSIRNALDNVMKIRQREGRGNNPKKADVVSREVEKMVFEYLADDSSPKKVIQSLIYTLGINLMLRSGEHRSLSRNNFEVRL